MNNYPLSSIEYTQTHTHLTLRLPISTFCKIFLPYFLDGLGVLKHKDCHPACTVQEQLQGFLVSDMQYAMIPSISSPIRSSTTGACCHLNCQSLIRGLMQTANEVYVFKLAVVCPWKPCQHHGPHIKFVPFLLPVITGII